ncbi:MAG: membrane lipoprotein lipid attachment site-containing protein [Prolixibacteraceae bacterium]|nr:membrane lipoprotein lipid attachment site-containing protein [Prolixibacteraceae bacterium]
MKKIAFLIVAVAVLASCSNQKKEQAVQQPEAEAVVYTVDNLYENAETLVNKEIVVKGTVMHVCKEGGERCFIMGSTEDVLIRVEAGEDIGAFTQEQMGSELEITGVLTEVTTEAESHIVTPGEEGEDKQTESAHQAIADAQETAKVEYYIKGLKAKEL